MHATIGELQVRLQSMRRQVRWHRRLVMILLAIELAAVAWLLIRSATSDAPVAVTPVAQELQ